MSETDLEAIAFSIVGHVGTARSMSMEAIRLSRTGAFEDAAGLLEQAHDELAAGHREHFRIITQQAGGAGVVPSMLLVHAEDQMMAAEVIRDLAHELIETNRALSAMAPRPARSAPSLRPSAGTI